MRLYLILSIILGIDISALLYETHELSIGYSEITLLHSHFSAVQFLVNLSLHIFGNNNFALRVPMIMLYVGSVILMFIFSKNYLKRDSDRLWLIGIFVLLPGVMSAAIVVNNAGFVIFGLLLYLILYNKNVVFKYLLLPILLVCAQSFMLLFLGLFVYAIRIKDKKFAIFNLLLFTLSLYMYRFNVGGLPKGHFLDTLAVYSAIFTPFIFIYIFYVLYRRYITSKTDIVWYLASTAFIVSLMLSFRQKLQLEMFAPYLIIALPLAAETFFTSYRVRLPQFRKRYNILFIITFIFLLVNAQAVVFNKYLYLFLKNPKENFAYNMQIADNLATKLKTLNIHCVNANNHKIQARLKFYGISYCPGIYLTKFKQKNSYKVTISYISKPVYIRYVTKLHN